MCINIKYMKNLLILMGCLLGMTAPALAKDPSFDPAGKTFEIPFEMDRNLIVIRARIAEKPDNKFIFDTGTSGLTLSESFATQNKLQGEGFTAVGRPNDPHPVQARNIVVHGLSIGGFETSEVAGVAVPDEGIFLPPGVAGIVSLSIFDGYCVTIDYAHARLRVQRGILKAGGRGVIALEDSEILESKISVNGKEMPANLDCGGPEHITFPLEWKSELALKGEPVLFAKALTGSGEVEIYKSQLIGMIQIGDIQLQDPEITLISGGFPAINIGYPFLLAHTLSVDRALGLIRLQPSKKPKG